MVLYEKFGDKCVKILKFWRTDLSYAQNKNRGEKMRLLGMDTDIKIIQRKVTNLKNYLYHFAILFIADEFELI
jgi:hypothetical protein